MMKFFIYTPINLDNKSSLNSEKEKAELERLKGKVPKQMVTMFSVD